MKIALAGNPNSGKTSIFNVLTGSRQHVGNYPGVTVEKREGKYQWENVNYEVLDLPGTYSLNGYSPEEQIAQKELLKSNHDLVVFVVDSTALRRSLVFLCQLMQLESKIVLCLNMADEAEKSGQKIDRELFEKLVGFPVVETVAYKGIGIDALKKAVARTAATPLQASRLVLGERLTEAVRRIRESLSGKFGHEPGGSFWQSVRLLQGDPETIEALKKYGTAASETLSLVQVRRAAIEAETSRDISLYITEQYYGFVDGLLREVTLKEPHENARKISDFIDSILANRVLGLPIFLAIMYATFWITFTVGDYPVQWIQNGFGWLSIHLSSLWPVGSDSALRSLLVDGIIAGVGGVVGFVPNIVLLFMCLVILEDTGYMARAAFLMDKLMHVFGLHGRSFIPLMSGFGCSVPAIMATRTLENERDRLTTMLVLPLMSCGARLPIWMLLIPAFFAQNQRAAMMWAIYMIGILLAFLLAFLLRRTVLKGEDAPFVMELPPYRLPTLRAVINRMIERAWLYLQKAGTIILAVSILMWCLTSYPKKEHFEIDAELQAGRVQALSPEEVEHLRAAESLTYSVAGRVGHLIEPVIRPLGFDWKIGVGLIGAFVAKEVFVAQMGVLYSLGDVKENTSSLQEKLRNAYSTRVGFSLMLYLLIATPCMATVAITRRESGRWKWALLQFGGLTAIAYVLSFLFFNISRFFV
ncbi:MAG: ferrous iron transport protein B [Deltaproteobacteria bacterium]|nr:ferrous iron transport protein B [Deltaproteobacteria bacterium]